MRASYDANRRTLDLALDEIVTHTLNRNTQVRHPHSLVIVQGQAQFVSEKAVFLKLMVEAIFAVRKQVEKQRDGKSEEKRKSRLTLTLPEQAISNVLKSFMKHTDTI